MQQKLLPSRQELEASPGLAAARQREMRDLKRFG
jgi:hypothetical protein